MRSDQSPFATDTDELIGRIVAENLGVYRASPARLQEDVSQEAQVASDYRGRLIFELLQNADDAMGAAATTDDRVAFLVTDEAVWIANSGRSLTEADVRGLCGLGASSKVDASGPKRASIGHKGLGFKSVLEITDTPKTFSRSYCFELGAAEAQARVGELWAEEGRGTPTHVPSMRFPRAVDGSHIDAWQRFLQEGYNTAFCLPFHSSVTASQRRELARSLLTLPLTTVLFLKNLERVSVLVQLSELVDGQGWTLHRRRHGEQTAIASLSESGCYEVDVRPDSGAGATFLLAHAGDVAIGAHRGGLTGPAWDGVEQTEVTVAALHPDEPAEMAADWRRFHVFLPTQEPNAYPLLVNGAFATDLSRRHVTVSDDPHDYNAHLVRTAGALVVDTLIPALMPYGVDAVLAALDRGEAIDRIDSTASGLLHQALVEHLAPLALLPVAGRGATAIGELVLPPPGSGSAGAGFRACLPAAARWDDRWFPDKHHCGGRVALVLADHGAHALETVEGVRALAELLDPQICQLHPEPGGRYEQDPVLTVLEDLWHGAESDVQTELADAVRHLPLFPTTRHDDGTVERVVLGDDTAFYPPRAAGDDIALNRLRFLCHQVCWGTVARDERLRVFGEHLTVWTALFGIREFLFPDVVRAAVLPALVLDPEGDAASMLEDLRDVDALEAICRLAGRTTKPESPLRYQRLEADRALANLARLPVPCRASDDTIRWEPAYRVYFGSDWLGEDSVEHLLDGVPDDDPSKAVLNPVYLAPPRVLLRQVEAAEEFTPTEMADEGLQDDEVPADDDDEQALEGDERERWIAFLTWLGVNPCLRLIHFHDVNESGAGWLTTKNFDAPQGRAFQPLGHLWNDMRQQLRSAAQRAAPAGGVTPYLYQAHELDLIKPLLDSGRRDASSAVATRLYNHLVRHWTWYSRFVEAEIALVPVGKAPGSRTVAKPKPEERRKAGPDLWLLRLRQEGICPTAMGPRAPVQVWQRTSELERRFGRTGRTADQLLPVLLVDSSPAARQLADQLGVRSELSPGTFTLDDARNLCDRIARLWPTPGLSDVPRIKGVYREMFELLTGRTEQSGHPLAGTLLLAETPEGVRYRPASELLYARAPGARARSGVSGLVSSFILDAEPGATGPVTNLFGARVLEDTLSWEPESEELGFDDEALAEFRQNLQQLEPILLARIRVERSSVRDASRDSTLVRELLQAVEPVRSLQLTVRLDGEVLEVVTDRSYHVSVPARGAIAAQVVWPEQPWPPTPEAASALAMALCDVIGLSLVEAFDSLIRSEPDHRRRLLALAGALGHLDELSETADDVAVPEDDDTPAIPPTASPTATSDSGETLTEQSVQPAAAVIPLYDFASLTLGGHPLLVTGIHEAEQGGSGEHRSAPGSSTGSRRAAAGTDLSALDDLGMRITIAYELNRLRGAGTPASTADAAASPRNWVVPVDTPQHIAIATRLSPVVRSVFEQLEAGGISQLYPGFDVLTIVDGRPDRLIELKSSGVDARVQEMSWNEWKSAGTNGVREHFWLYLVGNLRADMRGATPFVRAIKDPFGSLASHKQEHQQSRRVMQLRVREFAEAEVLNLGLAKPVTPTATDRAAL